MRPLQGKEHTKLQSERWQAAAAVATGAKATPGRGRGGSLSGGRCLV
jgi:hypothetical protein